MNAKIEPLVNAVAGAVATLEDHSEHLGLVFTLVEGVLLARARLGEWAGWGGASGSAGTKRARPRRRAHHAPR
jgi:hypothetical protein